MQTSFWLQYFHRNYDNKINTVPKHIPLSPAIRKALTSSLPSFQLGEASEGRHLLAVAAHFSSKTANPAFLKCMQYFIAEEQRHSEYLGTFMEAHNIPFATKKFTHTMFCFLRRLAGIELIMRVLVTAEIVALTYYRCLAEFTESDYLREVCNRMLTEEIQHLQFEMHHIHWINIQKFPLFMALSDIAHAFLLAGTACVAWIEHRKILGSQMKFVPYFLEVFSNWQNTMNQGRTSAFAEIHGSAAIEEGGWLEFQN